jgi:mRNA deadenylase 3'-5' endonuclease subunit Ccr4
MSMPLSVASYNVLADAYVRPERYPGVPLVALDFMAREPLLLRRVAGLGADVICLQEVEHAFFPALDGHLRTRGYVGHYVRKGNNKPDGCATFVREAVKVEATQALSYADGSARPKCAPTGCVALLMLVKWDGLALGIANTHLKWDAPDTPEKGRLGLRQITQLLKEKDTLLPGAEAWIVCGDFNAIADDPVTETLRKAGLVDAYHGMVEAHTCVIDRIAKRIDYVFHSPNLKAKPGELPMLGGQTLLPSPDEPSDHVPIMTWLDRVQAQA